MVTVNSPCSSRRYPIAASVVWLGHVLARPLGDLVLWCTVALPSVPVRHVEVVVEQGPLVCALPLGLVALG